MPAGASAQRPARRSRSTVDSGETTARRGLRADRPDRSDAANAAPPITAWSVRWESLRPRGRPVQPSETTLMNSPLLKLSSNQTQSQNQTLTPRLQFAVKLLQMSALDYEQELHDMTARNPFL